MTLRHTIKYLFKKTNNTTNARWDEVKNSNKFSYLQITVVVTKNKRVWNRWINQTIEITTGPLGPYSANLSTGWDENRNVKTILNYHYNYPAIVPGQEHLQIASFVRVVGYGNHIF